MGDKRGRSMEKTGEEPARIGKGQERTWKGWGRTREVSYIMQRTCSIQFGSTYMQQCIYYFMLSVSVLDQVVLTGVTKRVPWRLPGWILELILDRFLT